MFVTVKEWEVDMSSDEDLYSDDEIIDDIDHALLNDEGDDYSAEGLSDDEGDGNSAQGLSDESEIEDDESDLNDDNELIIGSRYEYLNFINIVLLNNCFQ